MTDPATPERMNAEAEQAFPLDGSDPTLVFTMRQAFMAGWLKHKQLEDEAWNEYFADTAIRGLPERSSS